MNLDDKTFSSNFCNIFKSTVNQKKRDRATLYKKHSSLCQSYFNRWGLQFFSNPQKNEIFSSNKYQKLELFVDLVSTIIFHFSLSFLFCKLKIFFYFQSKLSVWLDSKTVSEPKSLKMWSLCQKSRSSFAKHKFVVAI